MKLDRYQSIKARSARQAVLSAARDIVTASWRYQALMAREKSISLSQAGRKCGRRIFIRSVAAKSDKRSRRGGNTLKCSPCRGGWRNNGGNVIMSPAPWLSAWAVVEGNLSHARQPGAMARAASFMTLCLLLSYVG